MMNFEMTHCLFTVLFIINVNSLKIFYNGLNGGYRQYQHTKAQFGPETYNITDKLKISEPLNGCDINKYYDINNNTYNKIYADLIVVVQRGVCTFSQKVYNLQKLGAKGVIVGDYNTEKNNDEWITMNKNDDNNIYIPSIFIQYKSYKKIIDLFNNNIYNTNNMYATLDRDGLYDDYNKSKWLTVLSFAIIIVPILWCCIVIIKLTRKQCKKYRQKLKRITHIKTIPIITYKVHKNNNNENNDGDGTSDNTVNLESKTDNDNINTNDDGSLTEALIIEVETTNIIKKIQNKLKSIKINNSNNNDGTPLNDNCCICLDEFKNGDKVKLLYCLHGFHPKCVEPWFKKSEYCPMCKQSIFKQSNNDDKV